MSSSITYHIAGLLEKMSSPDKDFRFMATNDLMSELQKDSIKLDEDSERKVVKMLLKLLEDKNGEVQNLAVRCLGPLITKVKETQVDYIVDTLCSNMVSTQEELRDVSGIGLKTVIAQVPLNAGNCNPAGVCKRITPKLINSISQDDIAVQLEALDILADLLVRFGMLLSLYHQSITECLLPLLTSPRLVIRKRAIIALGHLVVTCSTQLFKKIMDHIQRELEQATEATLSTTRTYVNCIAAVGKAAAHRFGDYLPTVVTVLEKFCDFDDDELREFCIQAFEAFVVRCPKEINPHLRSILAICSKYVAYDPNYHYDDDDEAMGDPSGGAMEADGYDSDDVSDDGADSYTDDEDMSWKVRRASAKCLEAIVSTRRELLPYFHKELGPLLIGRFKEREENVKGDIFAAYSALLKHTKLALPNVSQETVVISLSTSLDNQNNQYANGDMGSFEDEQRIFQLLISQVPLIIHAVSRQLRERSIKTKQCCFSLLSELLQVLPGALSVQMNFIVPGIQSAIADKNSNSNIKVDTLNFLHSAFLCHAPTVFHPFMVQLVPLIVSTVGDSFYKVVAEGLRVIQQLVHVIRPLTAEGKNATDFDYKPYLHDIYAAVNLKLKTTDIDQEVKEHSISSMGAILATFGDNLKGELTACLPVLVERLKNEIARLTSVRAFATIAQSPLKVDLTSVLNDILPELATFLRKNQRALKISTLYLLHTLAQNYIIALNERNLDAVLVEIPPLISESDLQIVQMSLKFVILLLKSNSRIISSEILNALMTKIEQILLSPLLQGGSLNVVIDFCKTVVATNAISVAKLIQFISTPVYSTQQIHKNATKCIASTTANLVVASPELAKSTIEQLISHLYNMKSGSEGAASEQVQYFSLLTLGEIGRIAPQFLSGLPVDKALLRAFESSREEIQKAASLALGGIAAGDLTRWLPFVLNEINTQPKRQYLLLISLKEIISVQSVDPQAADIIRPHIGDIWQVLLAHCEAAEEGTRNVVAECLGKLCLLEPELLLPKLKGNLMSDSPLARATAVTAIRFTIVDRAQPIDTLLKMCIGEFLNTLQDPDLNVRRVALVTFNSAAHNKPALVRDLLETLMPNLYNETVVRKELIREVEMGPFKHSVDDGLDLRKAAFECMYTLLESCVERLDIFEFLKHIEDGLKDHYDIKMLTYLMLTRLAALCPTQVMQRLDRLVDPLKQACIHKVKANAVKQEFEKQEELKRSALRAFIALQHVAESDKNALMNQFMAYIKGQPDLMNVYEVIQRDRGVRTNWSAVENRYDVMDTS